MKTYIVFQVGINTQLTEFRAGVIARKVKCENRKEAIGKVVEGTSALKFTKRLSVVCYPLSKLKTIY